MKCYDGWTKYKGSCYMRAKKPANYNTAKADCVSKQGNLLVVNDRDEMDFLAGKLIIFLIISKIYVYDITWIYYVLYLVMHYDDL